MKKRGWRGEGYRHGLAGRGIKTSGGMSMGKVKVKWLEPSKDPNVLDPDPWEKTTEMLSFEKTQELMREMAELELVTAQSSTGRDVARDLDGVVLGYKYRVEEFPDGSYMPGSIEDYKDKFLEFTGEEKVRLSLTSGFKSYSRGRLKGVRFKLGLRKKDG